MRAAFWRRRRSLRLVFPSTILFSQSWCLTHVWGSSPNWGIVLRGRGGEELRGAVLGAGKRTFTVTGLPGQAGQPLGGEERATSWLEGASGRKRCLYWNPG